jgi:DNA-binding transcriptional LysR family regulator
MTTANALLSRLRLKQLGLVIALDQQRSLRKAASELAMTQSAASKALAEIEGILGGTLFERSRVGIVPNALGRCVIRYAWLLRADVDAMWQEVSDIRLGHSGRLSVGAIMGAVPLVLTEAIAKLREEVPEISIEIVEDTSQRLLQLLDQGQLEVAIARVVVSARPALYRYTELADEPLSVAAGPEHPLARARKVTLKDLQPYNWIAYPSRMPLRALLEREMTDAGMTLPTNFIETSSTFATATLLRRSSDLVALLPQEVCEFFSAQKLLRTLPIALKSRTQPFGIVTRTGGRLSAVAQRFVDVLLAAQGSRGATTDRRAQ